MARANGLGDYLSLRYRIVLTPAEDGWSATIPDWLGCMAAGDTVIETLELLEDARRSWLEASLARGLPIPAPTQYT